MAFGFNTGPKVLDNYYEAYFSVIKQYCKIAYKSIPGGNPFNSAILPTIKSTIANTRGIYLSGAYNNYYANLYKSFLSKKGIKKAFSGYNLSGVNTAKILIEVRLRCSQQVPPRQRLSRRNRPGAQQNHRFGRRAAITARPGSF